MASITIENALFTYGSTKILDNFNLEIKDKEFLVLVGPSGCGKSSLLRLISGLSSLEEGEIYVDELAVNNLEPKNRDIAMVFQSYALYPHLSVRENIAFPLKIRKMSANEIEERVSKVAQALELEKLLDRKPKELSGGQRQRVAMGRAIIRRPKAFLFDEPLSNLDASLRDKMRTEIKKRHDNLQTTTIYVTHDQTEAMTLADRIVVLNKGSIQQLGTPFEIYDKPQNIFVAKFMGSPNMNFCDGSLISEDFSDCHFGFRPEDLGLNINPTSDDFIFDAKLEVCEPLGSEDLLSLRWNDQIIQWKSYKRTNYEVGEYISLKLHKSKVHLFDKSSECRVEKPDALCDTGHQLPNKTNSVS